MSAYTKEEIIKKLKLLVPNSEQCNRYNAIKTSSSDSERRTNQYVDSPIKRIDIINK